MPTSALGMMMGGGMSQQGEGAAPYGMMTGTGGTEGNYQQHNANVLARARRNRICCMVAVASVWAETMAVGT